MRGGKGSKSMDYMAQVVRHRTQSQGSVALSNDEPYIVLHFLCLFYSERYCLGSSRVGPNSGVCLIRWQDLSAIIQQ